MNINFKAQPEPELTPYGKATYFVCRHTPHPKTVCHIKGLNDAPICAVKDRGINEGHAILPGPAYSQLYKHTGTTGDASVPRNTLPNLPTLKTEQFMRDELTRKITNTPMLKQKSDLVRKLPGDRATDRHLSPGQVMRYRPEITENFNYAPTYLEYEIQILEKLRDILQTDSLAEIQNWLSKASIKEKEFVSNFIRSDVTTRDLLNYQQKAEKESEAQNLNVRSLMKSQKGVQKRILDEDNQPRTSTQGSEPHKDSRAERSRHNSLSSEKIRIPTSEDVPLEDPSTRQSTRQSLPQSRATLQTSSQLLYRKSRAKRHLTSKEGARI
ncbi:uncharacterized protein C4orf17 homolog isoform X2 [Anolis carolinensis]|uniref:Chromosome 4 open reading frame 17 n=1 Tax=Anolis carolinensis TaxID=28377 RepID=R4GBF8_ANOCA|nr:PREDICTED: uncharacterized protein C4orf17 homolog isoform X1 [Anolis carolinensis]XP_008116485.1 PREDICTED: uncharacterized protein C4orf17 homolog isoform X1 [Anolis carolinensis]XP_008116486.1 PREDICTED: uncharacterized protein C4orf17 homolog isoform X1 [Anolis carolinensis]XP_016851949.1 PREDICTED: uncharacterized protein C4orf17 homolog isoform X1 [Anolis carolinensis]|eukprot:XP_008116484.1 PREDICTED: uncharacterized protein C4orf17 homolog isoform X1 [Anolis carolinensis]